MPSWSNIARLNTTDKKCVEVAERTSLLPTITVAYAASPGTARVAHAVSIKKYRSLEWPRSRLQQRRDDIACFRQFWLDQDVEQVQQRVLGNQHNEEPHPMEVCAEVALARIEDKDMGFNTLEVHQYLPMNEEALDRLAQLIEQRHPRGPVSMGLIKVWSAWERIGLPRALRVGPVRSRPPRLQVVRLYRPSVEELFSFVMQNQPVIISGALEPIGFPPLANFGDFNYLRQRCGWRPVQVKQNQFRDKDGRQVFVTDPATEVAFEHFLSELENAEARGCAPGYYLGKSNLQQALPELVEDLESSPAGPMQQYGSCLGPNPKGVHTYFGCGGNTTATHCDPSENLLAVLSGTKVFYLYPPTDADCLYVIRGPGFLNSAVPPFTDPDAMPAHLKESKPLYRHTRPVRVELVAGDMMYLPMFWWHCVTGCQSRNMLVNYWCSPHPRKEEITGLGEGAMGLMEAMKETLVLPEGEDALEPP